MDTELLAKLLEEHFPSEALKYDEPMSMHTTFGIGGPADFFVSVSSIEDIKRACQIAREADAPRHIIGAGSDLLIADTGLRGLVIHLGERFADICINENTLHAQAGASNEAVANAALEAGLTGYEFACGIPGSIGGAAIMNAGAYEGEFSHVCSSVTCLDPSGKIVTVNAAEADWSYRHSMMSDKGYIVLDATLQLVPWNKEQIRERMEDLQKRRASKQPLELGSAGSTFKRPLGYFAGKLIQDAGMRGHTRGGAQVSTKHCGFVVNMGNASAQDVRNVIDDVQKAVLADSGVHLEPEVRMWGFED